MLSDKVTRERVRGTQTIVEQMGWVFTRPSLTALEVLWRWVFGIPMLLVCYVAVQKLFALLPPDATGLSDFDISNPWLSSVKVAVAWDLYRPHVVEVLRWLAPAAALAWIAVSGIGRNLVLKRLEPRLPFRPMAMMVSQAVWLAVLVLTGLTWWSSIAWTARTHIGNGSSPDLVGYAVWAIFLSLGFFSLWALVSWWVAIAPMLLLLEDRTVLGSLWQSLKLGKTFTSKLVEINMVMGIAKLCLLVLAMVFSAVLIPFADQVGASTLHEEWLIVSVFYFIASDYFQVVRLKGFIEFWKLFRGSQRAPAKP
ncbi:MAG TPA: hypothetical protein VG267_13605 [Terracidiphilus sp.]|nr:hypothetical protein [Terracidiphilus sp.]